jgi:hypothetical protein
MDIDEEKGLRLRKTKLEAELNRINQLLHDQAVVDFEAERATLQNWVPKSAKGTDRAQFYKDAENDFRNADSNGNYSG